MSSFFRFSFVSFLLCFDTLVSHIHNLNTFGHNSSSICIFISSCFLICSIISFSSSQASSIAS
ncbi:MAG: hypothetical protein LBC61_03545 [Candidatus Peribacteria bacterium]|nr:hypothetical protein [Candidatus Peribacteria bacterium]